MSTRTKTSLCIYFYVIMESDDFKTALEVALQFFPGIRVKRNTRNCASKPACQTKRRPHQVFVGSGYQTGYFIVQLWVLVRKQSSLCRGSPLSSFSFIFTSGACIWSHLASNRNWSTRTGCRRCLWPGTLEAKSLSPCRVPYNPPMPPVTQRTFCSSWLFP